MFVAFLWRISTIRFYGYQHTLMDNVSPKCFINAHKLFPNIHELAFTQIWIKFLWVSQDWYAF